MHHRFVDVCGRDQQTRQESFSIDQLLLGGTMFSHQTITVDRQASLLYCTFKLQYTVLRRENLLSVAFGWIPLRPYLFAHTERFLSLFSAWYSLFVVFTGFLPLKLICAHLAIYSIIWRQNLNMVVRDTSRYLARSRILKTFPHPTSLAAAF